MTQNLKGTILSHRTGEKLETLRNGGFEVVEIAPRSTTDPWGFVICWREAILEKGKLGCYIMLADGETVAVDREPQYWHEQLVDLCSLEELLALPEETIEEQRAREYQQIVDARCVAKDGTSIYVVPSNFSIGQSFVAPEKDAILCIPMTYEVRGGERCYKVYLPKEKFMSLVRQERVLGIEYKGQYGAWVETTEAHIAAIVRKLTA